MEQETKLRGAYTYQEELVPKAQAERDEMISAAKAYADRLAKARGRWRRSAQRARQYRANPAWSASASTGAGGADPDRRGFTDPRAPTGQRCIRVLLPARGAASGPVAEPQPEVLPPPPAPVPGEDLGLPPGAAAPSGQHSEGSGEQP